MKCYDSTVAFICAHLAANKEKVHHPKSSITFTLCCNHGYYHVSCWRETKISTALLQI
jgi:hypothetical protein